jgi:hypothetical protein
LRPFRVSVTDSTALVQDVFADPDLADIVQSAGELWRCDSF